MSVAPNNLSLNGTSFFAENHGITGKPSEQRTWNVFLFCLTCIIAFAALLGSVYSLVSLLKMQTKTTVSMIVTSLSIDDLISIVPVIIFMLAQWSSEVLPQPLCTTSALMYLFQGISSNLKGSLIVSYNFYTINKTETVSCGTSKRRVNVVWAILTIWIVCLLICILPLCDWGKYIPTSWGCFTDCASSYVLFLFVVYSLCFCLLTVLSVPLTYQLLCSDEQQLLHIDYQEISGGCVTPGTPVGCSTATPSLSAPDPVDRALQRSQALCPSSGAVFRTGVAESGAAEPRGVSSVQSRNFTVAFAQKRFSLILALTKVILWLPMMIQMVVQHITGFQSLSFETLSFLLTLLAATVTPVFVLSEHWIHLPCGCVINCRRNSYAVSSEELKTGLRHLQNLPWEPPRRGRQIHVLRHPGQPGLRWRGRDGGTWHRSPIRQRPGGHGGTRPRGGRGSRAEVVPRGEPQGRAQRLGVVQEQVREDPSPALRRGLSHPSVCIPRNCIPSGTHGKNALLVYIREVLEICDNEEALDTVSIISNISQSSAQVRSPSLRYSRKENRFVSCDLGETASYSLFIPSNNPGSDINISIPDTVEAHRQNSKRQQKERGGYQEEIQMLNKAYRKREEDGNSN
ncbi:probable G-protein coupled receptor 149 isoform X2 [Patagioenas fasciata]|uniref:probable G-protein coupled receptor 149 isoform X2 n=1 Tax=Patagioenas fasciata TaxID=372321 RepID=UPI003A98E71D